MGCPTSRFRDVGRVQAQPSTSLGSPIGLDLNCTHYHLSTSDDGWTRAGGPYLLKPPPNGVPHISILRWGKGAKAALHVVGQSNWTRSQLYPYHLSTSDDGWTRPTHHAPGSVPAYKDSDACRTVSRSSSYR